MADYLEAVKRPGGEPVELDYQRDDPADIVHRTEGLLLTGGGDVDPSLYGETPHETFQPSEPGRDEYEIALVRVATEAGLPIFAICRGMQVLNVALGGTLIQDIPSMVNGAQPHAVPEPRFAIAHEVWVAKGSQRYRHTGPGVPSPGANLQKSRSDAAENERKEQSGREQLEGGVH